MDSIIIIIKRFLYAHVSGPYQDAVVTCLILLSIAVMAVISYYVCKWLLYLLGVIIDKTPTKWDDDLFDHRFMRVVSQLAPAITVSRLLPAFFRVHNYDYVHWIATLATFYIIWAATRIVVIFFGNLYEAFYKRPKFRAYAVKGIFEMFKLIAVGLGVIVGISVLIGKQPLAIITALGASAAVLMLVFRDTILGLVASIQLSANKMLRRGDWIVVNRHGADGEVVDVSLTTVKVRNWDNSISTIPPYTLISESFRNYQPMRQSGGRRVSRSIYIDMNSVRFCTAAELAALDSCGWLEGLGVDRAARQVNLALLRRYLERYISHHPDVNAKMLHMVRQMEPTQSGLPVQLYFFTSHTGWKDFEHTQAEIFDHVYAVVAEFGLRIFQTPTGGVVLSLGNNCGPFALQMKTDNTQ